MSEVEKQDMEVGGESGLYYCPECDPKCDKGVALPGKCFNCGNPLTNEPPVKTLEAECGTNKSPVDY